MKENRKRKEKIINKEMMNEIFVINYQFSRSDVTGSLLSLGVNLLGHNGNSQDGRMKVLIRPASRWFGLRVFTRFTPF